MTEARFYNTDPRYEMMAALLPDPKTENLPDAEQIVDDLREVIKLCYAYTLEERGGPKERTASELAEAIISHLFIEWGMHKTLDLAQFAQELWIGPEEPEPDE